jgi:hypothetical protein
MKSVVRTIALFIPRESSGSNSHAGADFDLALDKLLRPEITHHGLNTFMFVCIIFSIVSEGLYIAAMILRDGATFAIMISALSIRLDQMVHIATTMASTKLTQQEKDKLIAWRNSIFLYCHSAFMSSNRQVPYSHYCTGDNSNPYQTERRLHSKVRRYVFF